MPITKCQVDKKQGYRWGNGACYPYKAGSEESRKSAYGKALNQGRAIHRALDMKGGMMKTQTIHKVFGAAGPAVFTPSGIGGVAKQWPDEGLRELTEQSALAEVKNYIDALGWPAAWITHVTDAVMDRFYAAFARQQRWDDAYLSAKTAVGEYHRQYLDYEAETRDRLARGLEPEPPAWTMPESVAAEAEQIMNEKVGGGMMMKPLSLRGVLMASASLGDLLAVLKQVQGPTDHVKKAVKQLEGMVAKYDEGAGAKDVKAAAIKAIQTLLKKVPKPTEDHPRTRVMRALKLLEEMLDKNVSAGVLSASIVEVAKLLKAIADQSDEVKKAVKMAADLADAYEKGAPQGYGNIVSVQGMTKLLKALEAIEDKPAGVTKAIKSLKGLMGTEEKSTLPGYGVSKLETATAPGVYRARLISEGPALDGTNWDAEQLKSAVERHLFDGVPLNAISYSGSYGPDIEYHLPVDSALVGQVVGNQVGFIQPGATWEFDDGLKKFAAFGNVCITDPSRRNLVDAMLSQGLDAPGMSIYADGSKDDNEMVTGITAVHSMDLVTFPAADGYILSQALTASIKEWGQMKTRLMAADTEGLPPADPAPAEAAPEAPAPAPAAQPVDVGASWTQAYTAWRTIDWMAQLNAVKAQGNVSDAIMKLMDKMKMSIDEFSQLALAGAPKEEYDKLVARYAPAAPALEAAPAVETPPAQAPAAPAAPAATVQSAIMDQRIAKVAAIARKLDQRVAQADVDELIERKVRASNLPRSVAKPLQASMTGQPLSAGEVDGFIRFEQDVCDSLAGNLAETAGVTIDGELHSDSNNDTLDGALDALFKSQEA